MFMLHVCCCSTLANNAAPVVAPASAETRVRLANQSRQLLLTVVKGQHRSQVSKQALQLVT